MSSRRKPDRYWDPYIAGALLGVLLFLTFFLTGHGLGTVDPFHAIQKAITPVHERLRVNVFVILGEIESAFKRLINHPAIVPS